MKRFIYCVYDTIRAEMNPPFLANNDAHALRLHQSSLKEVPAEFQGEMELYMIGEVTVDTMELEGHAPRLIPMSLRVIEEMGVNGA